MPLTLNLRSLSLTTAIALVAVSSAAQPRGSPIAPPSGLVGTWSWTLPDGSCTETHTYESDGSRLVKSGKEELSGVFEVYETSDPRFLQLRIETKSDNKRKDCFGEATDDTGKTFSIYVTPLRRGEILLCFELNLKECYGPFRRRGAA